MNQFIVNQYAQVTDVMSIIGGIISPSIFLLAILLWTIGDGHFFKKPKNNDAKKNKFSHSEPIVLFLLGSYFLFTNLDELKALPVAALIRISKIDNVDVSCVEIAYLSFTFATVAICASLSKIYWTHIRLEQCKWGNYQYYTNLSNKRFRRLIELLLRCSIAALVVLTQKHLSTLQYVKHIELLRTETGIPEQYIIEFLNSFGVWLEHFSGLLLFLYVSIFSWLSFVVLINGKSYKEKDLDMRDALHGTLWSTLPGMLMSWMLYIVATGRVMPNPFKHANIIDISGEWVMMTAMALVLVGFVVTTNLIVVIFRQVYPVVAESFDCS